MFKRKNLFGILDSSKIKQGGKLGALKILSPENKNLKKNSTIIISSASCQGHIYNSIKHFKKYGHKLVKLF